MIVNACSDFYIYIYIFPWGFPFTVNVQNHTNPCTKLLFWGGPRIADPTVQWGPQLRTLQNARSGNLYFKPQKRSSPFNVEPLAKETMGCRV